MATISRYTIFGERCSGTNYVQKLMEANFDLPVTWAFGWKHFFCRQGETQTLLHSADTKNTLFLCVVRNPVSWVNSLYRDPFHLRQWPQTRGPSHKRDTRPKHDGARILEMLTSPVERDGTPERDVRTGEQYRNIMDMRSQKLQFMLDWVPTSVEHYIIIRHEDLLSDFEGQLNKIRALIPNCVRPEVAFPVHHTGYKSQSEKGGYLKSRKDKVDWIKPALIYATPGFDPAIEKRLGYRAPEGKDLAHLRSAFWRMVQRVKKSD